MGIIFFVNFIDFSVQFRARMPSRYVNISVSNYLSHSGAQYSAIMGTGVQRRIRMGTFEIAFYSIFWYKLGLKARCLAGSGRIGA